MFPRISFACFLKSFEMIKINNSLDNWPFPWCDWRELILIGGRCSQTGLKLSWHPLMVFGKRINFSREIFFHYKTRLDEREHYFACLSKTMCDKNSPYRHNKVGQILVFALFFCLLRDLLFECPRTCLRSQIKSRLLWLHYQSPFAELSFVPHVKRVHHLNNWIGLPL